jgi:hypothetical protein
MSDQLRGYKTFTTLSLLDRHLRAVWRNPGLGRRNLLEPPQHHEEAFVKAARARIYSGDRGDDRGEGGRRGGTERRGGRGTSEVPSGVELH